MRSAPVSLSSVCGCAFATEDFYSPFASRILQTQQAFRARLTGQIPFRLVADIWHPFLQDLFQLSGDLESIYANQSFQDQWIFPSQNKIPQLDAAQIISTTAAFTCRLSTVQ
jgi:hypothetical protein